MAELSLIYSVSSNKGLVYRRNEDSYLVDQGLGLFAVADGVGGEPAGHVASRRALQLFHHSLQNGASLIKAIDHAHQSLSNQRLFWRRGMASTIVAAHFQEERFLVAWIGDSRAYLWSEDSLAQLTQDHTMAASGSPNVLSQVLGLSGLTTLLHGLCTEHLMIGEVLMLCSDGLYSCVDEAVMNKTLLECQGDLTGAAGLLVELALKAGAPDNVTVMLIQLSPVEQPGEDRIINGKHF